MTTIFDTKIREGLVRRINRIDEGNKPQWGKMNVYQMLWHNTYWNDWILGKGNHSYKQSFMGKLFGKMALKGMIKDEKPLARNIPTSKQFKAKGMHVEFDSEKHQWISLIGEYATYDNPDFIHDFFGNMSKEEIGVLVYKHTDHHLRQFGV